MKASLFIAGWFIGLLPLIGFLFGYGPIDGVALVAGTLSLALGASAGWMSLTEWRDRGAVGQWVVAPTGKGKGWYPNSDDWPPKPRSPSPMPNAPANQRKLETSFSKGTKK